MIDSASSPRVWPDILALVAITAFFRFGGYAVALWRAHKFAAEMVEGRSAESPPRRRHSSGATITEESCATLSPSRRRRSSGMISVLSNGTTTEASCSTPSPYRRRCSDGLRRSTSMISVLSMKDLAELQRLASDSYDDEDADGAFGSDDLENNVSLEMTEASELAVTSLPETA